MPGQAVALDILDLARWAPSGDNAQPWRFEIVSDDHIVVHGFDTRKHCVYDLDGHSSQLAIGGLLETIRIAASGHGMAADISRRTDSPETNPTFDVRLRRAPDIVPSDLLPCIKARCVQRRPLSTRPLTAAEKAALEASVGDGYRVCWIEGWVGRWRAARLMWRNAKLRLTIPEAFEVHRSIIEWNAQFSEDRIPERALGASRLTGKLMRFALASWSRVEFMNRWLGGTIAPRIELDLIPSLACAAHFLIAAESPLRTMDDYIAAGGAMQRFWLTATRLNLQLQPEMTPVIFTRYADAGRAFSTVPDAPRNARRIAEQLRRLFGPAGTAGVFLGRIGGGLPASSRSLRLPLAKLLVTTA